MPEHASSLQRDDLSFEMLENALPVGSEGPHNDILLKKSDRGALIFSTCC